MSKTTTNYGLIKPELTDAADITATNGNWDKIDAELKKKSGWGEELQMISGEQTESYAVFGERFDAIMTDMPVRSVRQVVVSAPWAYGQGYFLSDVYKYNDTNAIVIALSTQRAEANTGYGWRFAKKDGVWAQPEWVNPPMTPNAEYRTTERISGKAVYTRSVNGVTQYRLDGETTWKPYADAVGAIKKSGDTMTGVLTFKAVDNGMGNFHKNHTETADYGTRMQDVSKDGKYAELNVRAGTDSAYFRGNDEVWRKLYHEGYKPTATDVGALPTAGGKMTGVLTTPQIDVTDGYTTTTLTSDGAFSLGQLTVSGDAGSAAFTVSPTGLKFWDNAGYDYEVVHAGNITRFLGVAPATVE